MFREDRFRRDIEDLQKRYQVKQTSSYCGSTELFIYFILAVVSMDI